MMALCDGTRFVLLDSAEDHKAVLDGDRGPNTGGMGAYSPSPLVDKALAESIARTIFAPLVAAMADDGRPFRGLLYGGLMLTKDRGPMVIEWNCRFGDPETQAVLPRMGEDLLPWLLDAASGQLPLRSPDWLPGLAVCVVLAAEGYPGKVRSGDAISGLGGDGQLSGGDGETVVFHAGTKRDRGRLVTNGGRVLGVTANGANLEEARNALSQRYRNARNTMSDTTCDVAILMGSKSDLATMKPAADVLKELGLRVAVRVLSAHRTPEQTAAFVREAARTGTKVFICGAGGAAHLAGTVAAHTTRPVIGIPIAAGSLQGMDALLSTAMMPPGIPVATVAIGGAENAGLLAAQIVAISDPALSKRVDAEREARLRKVLEADAEVSAKF
jgi:phosphoribosylamine--glycine ligase